MYKLTLLTCKGKLVGYCTTLAGIKEYLTSIKGLELYKVEKIN